MSVTERCVIETGPYPTPVWHNDEDATALCHDTPDFAQQLAQLFGTFQRMNQQYAVDRHIRQRQVVFGCQTNDVSVCRGPADYPLLCGHDGDGALGFIPKTPHIGCRIADTGDAHAGDIRPCRPDIAPQDALRRMAQRGVVEIAKVDDIVIHGGNMRRGGPQGKKIRADYLAGRLAPADCF